MPDLTGQPYIILNFNQDSGQNDTFQPDSTPDNRGVLTIVRYRDNARPAYNGDRVVASLRRLESSPDRWSTLLTGNGYQQLDGTIGIFTSGIVSYLVNAITDSDTSFVLSSIDLLGITLDTATGYDDCIIQIDYELMQITDIDPATNTVTVTRAWGDSFSAGVVSTAAAHAAGSIVYLHFGAVNIFSRSHLVDGTGGGAYNAPMLSVDGMSAKILLNGNDLEFDAQRSIALEANYITLTGNGYGNALQLYGNAYINDEVTFNPVTGAITLPPAAYATTPAVNNNSTLVATTAWVLGQRNTTLAPAMDGTAAAGSSTRLAPYDHVHPTDTSRLATSGGTITGSLTINTDLTVKGNTALGDDSTDTLTVYPTTINLDSGATKTIVVNNAASGAGKYLELKSGASAAGTNLAGGHLYLTTGVGTGNGQSSIYFQTPTVLASGSTAQSAAALRMTVNETVTVEGALSVKGNTTLGDNVADTVTVTGTPTFAEATTFNKTMTVKDTLSATKASGTGLSITANATVGGTLIVTDAITANKATGTGLTVTSNATVSGSLGVGTTLNHGTTAGTTNGDMWYNSTTRSFGVRSNHGTTFLPRLLDTVSGVPTGATSTTEGTFASPVFTFPANSLTSGDTIEWDLFGGASVGTGTVNLTITGRWRDTVAGTKTNFFTHTWGISQTSAYDHTFRIQGMLQMATANTTRSISTLSYMGNNGPAAPTLSMVTPASNPSGGIGLTTNSCVLEIVNVWASGTNAVRFHAGTLTLHRV